eukprot:10219003-Ditylum_brightwellii.AAC.1
MHGLEGEYVCKGCFSSKSTSQSVDTKTAPPLPSTSPATVNTLLNTDASAAASVPPLILHPTFQYLVLLPLILLIPFHHLFLLQ